MSLLEHPTQIPAPAAASTLPDAACEVGAQESVRSIPLPPSAGASAFAPVGSFLADTADIGEVTAYGQQSPTVLVSVPLSQSVLEAACMNAADEVDPEKFAAWSDDQVRSWAVFEALGMGTVHAATTAEAWEHHDDAAWQEKFGSSTTTQAAGDTYERVSSRIAHAFGFDTAATTADTAELSDDVTVAEIDDADDDGWEL